MDGIWYYKIPGCRVTDLTAHIEEASNAPPVHCCLTMDLEFTRAITTKLVICSKKS